jgi:hypothetical protein
MSSIIRATTTSGLQVAPDNSGSLQLQTNGTTAAVTIDTSQNVGIGTTSPSEKLQVNGNIYISASGSKFLAYPNLNPAMPDYSWGGQTTGMFLAADKTLAFSTNATERMRIDSSGNLMLGTTSVIGGVSKQSISYSGAVNWGLGLNDTSSTNGMTYIMFQTGGTNRGNITNNNNTAVAYNTTSDYRLKENVVPMTGALDTISKLKPVTYKWKQNGSDGQGFIAHELQEVVPDCVTGKKDAVDAEGNPVYQGVDTSFLVATLTAAIQEQQTIINDLKARIETLEAK